MSDEKVVNKIPRAFKHVKNSIPLCDQIYLYENSREDDPFKHLITIKNGTVEKL